MMFERIVADAVRRNAGRVAVYCVGVESPEKLAAEGVRHLVDLDGDTYGAPSPDSRTTSSGDGRATGGDRTPPENRTASSSDGRAAGGDRTTSSADGHAASPLGQAVPSPDEQMAEILVLARTPTDLRRAATMHALLARAERVIVVAAETPYWYPAPAPSLTPAHRWRALTELRVHRPASGAWAVDARFSAPTPAGRTVAATARAFAGNRLDGIAAPVAALTGPGAAHWRPGDPNASLVEPGGPLPVRVGAPGGDVVLRTSLADGLPAWSGDEPVVDLPAPGELSWERLGEPGGAAPLDPPRTSRPGRSPEPNLRQTENPPGTPAAPPSETASPSGAPATRPAVHVTDVRLVPPVDDRSVNPMGFVTTPTLGIGRLERADGRWNAVHDGTVLTRFADSGCVTVTDVARLRQLRGLRIDWRNGHTGPVAAVRVVASLAAAGVPLITGEVPPWAAALGDGLVGLLGSVTPEDLEDDLRREEHSVRLRRRALRDHGVEARWERLGAPARQRPLTSVLLTTRRPEMVRFALAQAARQRDAELEVVLALHGIPRDHPAVAPAVAAFERPIRVVEGEASLPFGALLNRAAARASGSFLLKMDDDDWYGPDFLADLLLAHSYSGANVLGTALEFVYLGAIDVTVHRDQVTEQITNFVAGGTIFTERTAFDAVGGFRPLPRAVDTQFQHAVQSAGGQVYRTHGLGYVLRRGPSSQHTWREPIGTFLRRNKRQWRGFRPSALMELPETAAMGTAP
ncbi:glycosyltransferase [Microtetraspora niveoalba]|uniref:glycosyltransferase n=1 Tax=Microtetraspora niveoalba TaxID=46175 RepID=UPI000829E043|nr:glycosyltransferase [Microtetraspora niveoalba]